MAGTYFLGIDGGATNCRARIADVTGKNLGEGRGGQANTRLGIEQVFKEIVTATRQAMAQAGLADGEIAGIHAGLGLAGLSLESDMEKLLAYPHPFASVTAQTDAYVACLGAHGGEDGGIVIFGTGSCGCGILDGNVLTVGGWGFDISDQGSGAQIGLRAVRCALQAYDGIVPQTDLSRAVVDHFSQSPEQAVLWATDAKPADYADFAPLVADFADRGDTHAVEIMDWAAGEAAQLIAALNRKGIDRIALVGGFSEKLVPWMPDDIKHCLVEAKGDAMEGAIIMARRARARTAGIDAG